MSLARRAFFAALALTLAACSGSSSSSSSSGSTGLGTTTTTGTTTHGSSSGATTTSSTGSTGESSSGSSASSSSASSSGSTTASSSDSSGSTSASTSGSSSSSGSTGSTGSTGSSAGTLTIVLDTPANASASVLVTGVGFSQTLTAGSSLSVAPGTYAVTASNAITSDPVVGLAYAPSVSGTPAVVTAGATTTVTIDYPAPLVGSGMIWITDATDNAIVSVDSAQLQSGGSTLAPLSTLQMNDGGYAEAIAFDSACQPWAVDDSDTLYSWTLYADGGASSASQFNLSLVDGGQLGLQSLTFAPNGDLWMPAFASSSASFLVRVTPDQLLSPGNVVPAQIFEDVVDDGGFDSLAGPYGVAFDSMSNAWLVNIGTNTVVELAHLDDGGYDSYPAAVVYDSDGGVFNGLNGIAFDAQGDLWVASSYVSTVVHLSVAGLSGDSDVNPVAIIGPADAGSSPSLAGTDYASFDQSGALWVWSQDLGTLTRFDNPGQYTGSVAPAPDAFFVTPYSGDTGKFAFDPAPPGLRLFP